MTELTTPRAARSLADLRDGQMVAWCEPGTNDWEVVEFDGLWDWTGTEVILWEPPPEPVTVPHDVYDRLRKACLPGLVGDGREGFEVMAAARALVRAVEADD